jgi:hypothetical protein
MRKLTLSANEDVIRRARNLARSNRTSISAIFARLIRFMSRAHVVEGRVIGPLTKKASGIVSLPKGKSDRAVLEDALLEKYVPRR